MARTSRRRRLAVRRGIILGAAGAGALLAAAPTGVPGIDAAWCGGFVALLAFFGVRADPLVLLPAAAVATLLAGTEASIVLGVASVLAAIVSAAQARRSTRLTSLAAALIGLSLLQGSGPSSPPLAVLSSGGVALVVIVSGLRKMSPRRRRRIGRWALGGTAVLFVCAAVGGVAALTMRSGANRGINALRAAEHAGTRGDLAGAVDDARNAERAFRGASNPLGGVGRIGRIVPILSQQIGAARTAVDTAGDAAEALRTAGAGIDLTAVGLNHGAVDLARLAAAEPPLAGLADATTRSVVRLAGIDRSFLAGPVSDALDRAFAEAQRAAATADHLHRAVQVAPALLGRDRPTRFLVLFTSPDEARNRFGFPGAFAVLRFDAGHLSFERGGPIGLLDGPTAAIDQTRLTIPARVAPYVAYGAGRTWRSVTMPADGPSVADMALQLAAQTDLGRLDGVVLADPTALAGVIGLSGTVPVPGLDVTLTKDTTADFLVRRQYLEFPQLGQQADRKDLLSAVADEVGHRLGAFSLPSARSVLDTFGPLVQQGHLVVSVPARAQPEVAQLFGDVGLDGSFPRPQDAGADLLYVGQRNYVGNKIDLFLRRKVRYGVSVAKGGALRADLAVDLTNTAPAGGLPFYLIGAAATPPPPMGTNLTTTLIYSRNQLASVTLDGVAVTPAMSVDGGLYLYQVDVPLAPGQHRTLEAHLTGTAAPGPYALVAYPGTLVQPDDLSLTITDARAGGGTRTDAVALVAPSCRAVRTASTACEGRP